MRTFPLPEELDRLAQIQAGVLTRRQAIDGGMPPYSVDRLAESGCWPTLQRGVYSIYTGEPARQAVLWAAVLRAGPGAALSFETAAEVHRIVDRPSRLLHVSVPRERHIPAVRGLVLHRSAALPGAVHPTDLPPRTKAEETVLDLVGQATSFDAAFAIACAACQRRRTTPARIRRAMDGRVKLRWRGDLAAALAEIGSGVHSLLEYRYVRYVERPHGLPAADRQAKVVIGRQTRYLDNLYRDFGVCVELDGLAGSSRRPALAGYAPRQRDRGGRAGHAALRLDRHRRTSVRDGGTGRPGAERPRLDPPHAPLRSAVPGGRCRYGRGHPARLTAG